MLYIENYELLGGKGGVWLLSLKYNLPKQCNALNHSYTKLKNRFLHPYQKEFHKLHSNTPYTGTYHSFPIETTLNLTIYYIFGVSPQNLCSSVARYSNLKRKGGKKWPTYRFSDSAINTFLHL